MQDPVNKLVKTSAFSIEKYTLKSRSFDLQPCDMVLNCCEFFSVVALGRPIVNQNPAVRGADVREGASFS